MPTWSKPAQKQASEIEKDFKDDLRKIADTLAHHEKATSVSPAHVNRSFEALTRVGLCRRGWWDRPDAVSAIGGTLIGLSFSAPDVVNSFVDPSVIPGLANSAICTLFVIGIALVTQGYYWSRLPQPAEESAATRKYLWRAFIVTSLAIVIVGIFYLIWLTLW